MKRKSVLFVSMMFACGMLSSCYTYTSVVGRGPQGSAASTHHNHYLIDGLIPLKISDSKAMAGETKDYSVTTQHTFLDGLIGIITLGIYTPTTTTVTK